MIDLTLILVFFIVLQLSIMYMQSLPAKGLPPGPKAWPFIGNVNVVYGNHRFHDTLHQLAKKYGGLFSLQMVSQQTVVISDLNIMREALIDKAEFFSDRPMHLRLIKFVFGKNALVFQNGETWEKLRRLVISSMRNFGVGKATIEERIQDETMYMLHEIEKTKSRYFHPKDTFQKSVCNVICYVLFGQRFDYSNKEFIKFLDDLSLLMGNAVFQNCAVFLHLLALMIMCTFEPSLIFMASSSVATRNFVRRRVKEHRQTFDPDNIRDFVDMYLEAQQKADTNHTYTDGRIFQSIMDMFFAGTETTSTTLLWTFLFMIKYPDIQEKCREEIFQVIGHARSPCMKDKKHLPYLEATLREIMRIGLPTPIAGLHNTAEATTLAGYHIPKDTVVITNFYSLHMDPKLWPDPEKFNPERFLDEHGQLKNIDHYMPFGLGKRKCMGDNLAKMELFIVISHLLQKYRFTAKDINTLPGPEKATMGVTLVPPYYEMMAEKL